MRWSEIGGETCSIARTLSAIGDRWSLLILREAFLRTRRFADFQRRIGVARNILAGRLDHLVAEGILERKRYSERPLRFEYRLTEKGLDLHTVLMALVAWGDDWMDENDEGRPVLHVHRGCGEVMHMVGVCSECGEPIEPRAIETLPGAPLQRLGVVSLDVRKQDAR